MSTRKIKDAVDRSTNEKVYYKGHAKATYMSDGRTVEDAIKTAGGGGGMAVIDHGTEDTTFTLTSGVIHKWGLVDSLTLTVPEDAEGMVSSYRLVFTANSTFVLSLPENIAWANDEAPDFSEDDRQYEINIIGKRALWAKFQYEGNFGTGFLLYAENEVGDYVMTDYVISGSDYGVECKATLCEEVELYGVVGGARKSAVADSSLVAGYYANNKCERIDWSGNAEVYFDEYTVNKFNVFEYMGSANTISNGLPLMIYGLNQNGAYTFGAHLKIYYFRVLGSDGTPNLDLRPYRNDEGVVGFKDLVSGKFYTSVNNTLTGA